MSFYKELKSITTKEKTVLPKKTITKKPIKKSDSVDIDDISPNEIPLELVKQYLRVDHSFDDVEIALMLKSAQSYLKNYLKIPKEEDLEDDELIIPILALVSYFYENKTVSMKSNERVDHIFDNMLTLHRREIV